jgi:signal transduction histidine kinase
MSYFFWIILIVLILLQGYIWKGLACLIDVILHFFILEPLSTHPSHAQEERPIYTTFRHSIEKLINHFKVLYPRGSFELIISPYSKEGIDDETAIGAYSILEELICNCASHSKAKTIVVYVHLDEEAHRLHLYVEDNGVGFHSDPSLFGQGLQRVHDIVHTLKGEYTIQSHRKKGTIIRVELPYH